MHWTDDAIVLGTRPFGEGSVILEALTRRHGRHLGLVRGGRSRRQAPVLQPGNEVGLVWRARLDEHLGAFTVEPMRLRAGELMASATGLYGVTLLAAHLRLLAEREPHPALFQTAQLLLAPLTDPALAPALMVRFELAMLDELGFGLDLAACVLSGANDHLAYVSPKSGRAVSLVVGEPWKDRLLRLPAFLTGQGLADEAAVDDGFALSGLFLERHVWTPRALKPPDARASFIAAARRALAAPPATG